MEGIISLTLRPYREEDQPGVERILDQSWPPDATMRELHDLHGRSEDAPSRGL